MITRETEPCWVVTCDNCGEAQGGDDFGVVHHSSHEQAVDACKDYEWTVRRDNDGLITGIVCTTCAEEGADLS
jgi:hypothetical protein